MATDSPQLPHLQMVNRGVSQDYKSKKGRGPTLNIPQRHRASHGSALRKLLHSFVPISQQRQLERAAAHLDQIVPSGIVIEFQSAHGFDLAFQSLDLPSAGIELLNVRIHEGVTYATCFVPEGKLAVLIKKVSEYVGKLTRFKKPKNATLVESIQSIGLATIHALWTDEAEPPDDDELRWWEVWIRKDDLVAEVALQRFSQAAELLGIAVTERWLEFPERVVTILQATRPQLSRAVELLNLIAEVRNADLPPPLSHEPTLAQQDEFVAGMVQRLEPPTVDAVAIAVLDTGVARTHPLLGPALDEGDLHTVDPNWGTHDHHGHGTQMAGMALYGDLRTWAQSAAPVTLSHRLESVKILPPQGPGTAPELFGSVTEDAVALCEIEHPERKRIFCKPVSSPQHQDGIPSSYSATVDQLAYGVNGDQPRLFVLAAGNLPDHLWPQYPTSNLSYGVEQPGQAWNALTVGAVTKFATMPGGVAYAGWNPVVAAGDLSPFTATSFAWGKWPIKPDVLFEGGNAAVDASSTTDLPPTLQLLTTHRQHTTRPLSHICMTSPAAAQAARLAAKVQARYSDYWPETVRGLIVHHAAWTAQQRSRFLTVNTANTRRQLLRTCGWGVARELPTLHSVRNRVCLVTQETLQPYRLVGREGKMNEMMIFALPWPKEELFAWAEMPVRLKVTLSYFIEPSPSKRGWLNRYRYASHSLRFDLRRKTESIPDFNKRVNAAMLDKDEELDPPGDEGWFLGSKLRTAGSLHSDQWTGMAIDLASRDLLAVYPVVGWWRECFDRGHCEDPARFSLIVSLEALDVNLDLYTAVNTELQIPLSAELLNSLEPI